MVNYEARIIELNMENIRSFYRLVPPYALSGLDIGKKFGIGVLDGISEPVGILVFSYARETETSVCAILDWIYVLEGCRRNGIAGIMFGIFASTIKTLDVKNIKCRVLGFDKDEGLWGFLENQGFSVEPVMSDEILIYQEQLINAPIIEKKLPTKYVRHLYGFSRLEVRRMLGQFDRANRHSADIDSIDKNLSLVYSEDGETADAVLFVRSDPFGIIEPFLMNSLDKGKQAVKKLEMILYLEIKTLLQEEYEGTWIRIPVMKEKVLALADYLLPVIPPRDAFLWLMDI